MAKNLRVHSAKSWEALHYIIDCLCSVVNNSNFQVAIYWCEFFFRLLRQNRLTVEHRNYSIPSKMPQKFALFKKIFFENALKTLL